VREFNGWCIPKDDYYFDKFLVGGPFKSNGFQKEHLLEAFKYVRKWDYAVDVGAHVGFWAWDMAARFGKVYCFEPSPDTFACLCKNMAGLDNVELSRYALGDKEGRCDIQRDKRINSGSEFVMKHDRGMVPMARLDDLDLPGCDFLKVDVEGFEYMVLRGGTKLIEKYRPVVIMETDKKFASRRYKVPDTGASYFLLKRGYKEVAHMRPDKVFAPDHV
jgi:FkbM family methyltransferase